MKILVVGEGPGDIGRRDVWCEKTHNYVDVEGWLQPIIRSVKETDNLTFFAETRKGLKLQPRDVARLRPLPEGHGAKALFAKRIAIVAGYDVVVYLVDADSPDHSRWKSIVKEVEEGFNAIDGNVTCVACIPMSMAESWLLSDETAWERSTGQKPKLPSAPERLWGERNDPNGRHPHRVFAKICKATGASDNSITRRELAAETDLKILASKCAASFPPFASALRAA